MKLLLLRHGATEWSVTGQHTGRTDIPLTEQGREQAQRARAAVKTLAGEDWDRLRVFSSPLERAAETARIVFGDAREILIADELMEFDYGVHEGLTPTQIQDAVPGWQLWRDGCDGGETPADVGRRVGSFLASIEEEQAPVVAVAHGHLLRVLAARAIGLAAEQGGVFTLDTATVSLVEDVRGLRVIRLWNLDPALLAGG